MSTATVAAVHAVCEDKCRRKVMCPEEDCPANCPRRAIADHLEALTGGAVDIRYSGPDTWITEQADSRGHCYHGFLSSEADDDFLMFDDRQPLEPQLVSELRRIAAFYSHIADHTEANAKKAKRAKRAKR